MSLEQATHKAVHDRLVDSAQTALQALIAKRVYDRIPASAVFPYCEVRVSITPDENSCAEAMVANVTVNVWSAAVGKQEAEAIGSLVRGILAPHDADDWIEIDGYEVNGSWCDATLYRAGDNEATLTEGVVTFTYLVDPLIEET